MITLFILALFGSALLLLAVPVVAYALMLETVRERAEQRRAETSERWDAFDAASGVFDSKRLAA